MTAAKERTAACACGQLDITLSGEPQLVSSCHCLACQHRTGAVFASNSFWLKSQIAASKGDRKAFRRQGESGAWLTFQFCPNCGSTVFWENEATPKLVSVAIGCFADPQFPAPVRTVWTESKHGWLGFPASIRQHRRDPD